MRAVVLLSSGRHPASARPAPVQVEMQAIRLASDLGMPPYGLHVGQDEAPVRDALGHGLSRLVVLQTADPDPLEALRAHFADVPPDVIFAGRRGQGGSDTGLLPYRLAHRLGWPIVADIARLSRSATVLRAEQVLPRGDRRIIEAPLPCIFTVHPAAAPALPFRYAGLRGDIVVRPYSAATPVTEAHSADLRPYRARPKIMAQTAGGGRVMAGVSPEAAASAVIAELRRLKLCPS